MNGFKTIKVLVKFTLIKIILKTHDIAIKLHNNCIFGVQWVVSTLGEDLDDTLVASASVAHNPVKFMYCYILYIHTMWNDYFVSYEIYNISCQIIYFTIILASSFYCMDCKIMGRTINWFEAWGSGNSVFFSWLYDNVLSHPPYPVTVWISFHIATKGDGQSNCNGDVTWLVGDLGWWYWLLCNCKYRIIIMHAHAYALHTWIVTCVHCVWHYTQMLHSYVHTLEVYPFVYMIHSISGAFDMMTTTCITSNSKVLFVMSSFSFQFIWFI